MSEDKISIEFEKETLESIFKEGGITLPENPSEEDVKKAFLAVKKSASQGAPKKEAKKEEINDEQVSDEEAQDIKPKTETPPLDPEDKGAAGAQEQKPMDEIEFNGKNVLVVDDLGVVNYQLSCILKREGFRVHTTTTIMEGIDYFKTKRVDVAILDLFLPSEREGIILLEEIAKLRKSVNKECKIIMMSSDLKPEYKKLCKSIGASKFIEKTTGWHETVVGLCS